MGDPPVYPLAGAHVAAPRGRHHSLRPTSDSFTTRPRPVDDLFSHLTPRTVADALQNASGALKQAMDAATPAEQSFALRAAVASRSVQEWLDELTAWPWPTGGASAGFERPPPKRRKLSEDDSDDDDDDDEPYLGSLPADQVSAYEKRVDEIGRDMDELDVEEIKTHVLRHHIMPLSRPGTPLSEPGRPASSLSMTYARMDDITALVTSTILQALPNLSKLTRLMNIWSVRLAILRRSSSFLTAIAAAEVALQSAGKAAIHLGTGDQARDLPLSPPTLLTRDDFNVTKLALERMVTKAGQHLDHMLDTLEGRDDTLPDSWVDRMDALERAYGEWVTVCERRIRQAEWARLDRETSVPDTTGTCSAHEESLPKQSPSTTDARPIGAASKKQVDDSPPVAAPVPETPPAAATIRMRPSETPPNPSISQHLPDLIIEKSRGSTPYEEPTEPDDPEPDIDLPILPSLDRRETPDASPRVARPVGLAEPADISSARAQEPQQRLAPSALARERDVSPGITDDHLDAILDAPPAPDFPEPELPLLPTGGPPRDVSAASTIVRGSPSRFGDLPSSPLDHGTPNFRRSHHIMTDPIPSDDSSSSSPPDFRSSMRSLSVSFNDIPTVVELPNEDTPPRTPMDHSTRDEGSRERGRDRPETPTISLIGADDQLQQQISEILESIPAKITLTTGPSEVNLNPPDFALPSRSKSRQDPAPRAHSSRSNISSRASSRSGTPLFTLAPAYNRNPRPRIQRGGNPEIKLYHLTRSNGEPPIKLFIRCVGEAGERVMVRVGGGWADLGEYLKEYVAHHGRRSGGDGKVEVKDLPRVGGSSRAGSSPPSRPSSAMDISRPITPLNVRKTRRNTGENSGGTKAPKTPLANSTQLPNSHSSSGGHPNNTPSSGGSTRSRSSSRLSWADEESSLGMAGPRAKNIEMSEENKAWVESMKEKVRIASGSERAAASDQLSDSGRFGDMGKVGATKRLFRRPGQN